MSIAEDLGARIIKMNPYAGGLMEPHTFLAAPPPPPRPNTTSGAAPTPPTTTSSATQTPQTTATGGAPSAPTPTPAAHSPDASCIWMEMDKYRTGDWALKG